MLIDRNQQYLVKGTWRIVTLDKNLSELPNETNPRFLCIDWDSECQPCYNASDLIPVRNIQASLIKCGHIPEGIEKSKTLQQLNKGA